MNSYTEIDITNEGILNLGSLTVQFGSLMILSEKE